MWGRTVFDNIRKFLQYQLTVNLVALPLVFVGAVSGKSDAVLNAIMILWINLIASCMGALALATEPPTLAALARRPYKRNAFLITKPMRRNIICMTIFQFTLMMVLLFSGAQLFGVPEGITCIRYRVNNNNKMWDVSTEKHTTDKALGQVTCQSFRQCDTLDTNCYREQRKYFPNPQGTL
jgi:magnesium-transporting ATPase (P-type)